jgi:hypothetical protein
VNILITAATSALAHRLKTKLNGYNLLLGDHLELPTFMLSAGNMIGLPNPNSVTYIHEMLTLCIDNEIDTVYILRDTEAKLLMEAQQLFKEYNINLVNEI